ncbi:hypothetical protein JZO77_19030 [Enterococcus hulanensis]|uniref:hypothetical protein n=1 Tax=Enterococcus hulanensis TaxID=2559929 RepID=UPI001A8EDCB0|nr:hypothetical protein [Enterococcus hulanensis]MBO0458833.1 hypothetical protein [Enterococcus hulanensis]
MLIINWIIVGLVILILIIWSRRMFIKLQLERLRLPTNNSPSFQRKLDYVKQVELGKHVSALLLVILFITMGLLLTTYSLFRMEDQLNVVTKRNNQLKDELYLVKKEQKQLITKIPIKPYPKGGIGLKEYSWEELFSEENREKQYQIESDLSTKVSPYFGLSTTLIVLDVPTQTLNIALAGDSGSEDNRKQIKDNIKAFAKEAESISKLTQITFQMNLMSDKEKKKTYSCTFSRMNEEESFSLVQEEE